MKKVTAVVTKATPTHAAETKAENKQKQAAGKKPNTVPVPSSSSAALWPTSDGVEGVRSLTAGLFEMLRSIILMFLMLKERTEGAFFRP